MQEKKTYNKWLLCLLPLFANSGNAQFVNVEKDINPRIIQYADSLAATQTSLLSNKEIDSLVQKKEYVSAFSFSTEKESKSNLKNSEIYNQDVQGVGIAAMCAKKDALHGSSINPATAFVIGEDGICLTNFHVLYAFSKSNSKFGNPIFLVRLANGEIFPLKKIIGFSAQDDIAIIQIDTKGKKLKALPIAAQDANIGDNCYVLGNPLGQAYAFTNGIISNKYNQGFWLPGNLGMTNRNIMSITANFAVGSSGSPILDQSGNIIGIVSSTNIIPQSYEGQQVTQMVVRNAIPVSSIWKLIHKIQHA